MVTQGVSLAHFIHYPESDGQPMAETEIHGDIIEDVKYKLSRYYRHKPLVHVGGGLLFYYVEGDPTQCASPDVYVAFGLDKERRRTYKLWVERKPPDVIFEITSKSTKIKDMGTKKGLYEILGVREYFLIDPLGEYLDPPLQGYRLNDEGRYQPIEGPELESEALGLRIAWQKGEVVLTVIETGEVLLSSNEQADRAEQEAQRAEQEAQRAEQEAQRAEQETQRAEQGARRAENAEKASEADRKAREEAERQLAELKAKLEALEGKG